MYRRYIKLCLCIGKEKQPIGTGVLTAQKHHLHSMALQTTIAQDYQRLFRKASLEIAMPITILKSERRLIAGYASVAIIDKEGDLITIETLRRAAKKFLANPKYRNVMLEHSNIQVGEVLDEALDSEGRTWMTQVDGYGFFVVVKIRDDLAIADETWELIKKGDLNSFSIAGQVLKRTTVTENGVAYSRIDELELHELTVCRKGANPAAKFFILKSVMLNDMLARFPDLILFKDLISVAGSTAEKGVGEDLDLIVRLPPGHDLARHIDTRLRKLFSEEDRRKLHIVFGDEQGPHDTFIPLYDLALIRAPPVRQEMTLFSVSKSDSPTTHPMNVEKKPEERKADKPETVEKKPEAAEKAAEPVTLDALMNAVSELAKRIEKLTGAVETLKAKAKDEEESYPYPPKKKEAPDVKEKAKDKDAEKYPYPEEEEEDRKKKTEQPLNVIDVAKLSEQVASTVLEQLKASGVVLKRSVVPSIGGPEKESDVEPAKLSDEQVFRMTWKEIENLDNLWEAKRRGLVT